MVPRVETQLTMADAMRSGPSGIGAARANYAGSMLADTHEGEDPCHEDQLRAVPAPVLSPTPEERPGLTLDWNGENMVKAFVMQEVLTRPCQRRR